MATPTPRTGPELTGFPSRGLRVRDVGALVGALAIHAALLLYVTATPARQMFHETAPRPIDVEIVRTTPPPPPPAPAVEAPPEAHPPPTPVPRTLPTSTAPASPTQAPPAIPEAPPAPQDSPPTTVAPTLEAPTGESVVKLKRGDGGIGKVLGTGTALSPSTATLERSLELRADGPLSDKQRTAHNVKRLIEDDLADDAVTVGLADDYFHELKNRVESNWRPAVKDLNDGGAAVTQMGMLKGFVDDDGRVAWNEMWLAYLDLAKQYAQGQRPSLEPGRIDRLRELMRSRKGAFRYHAITEAVLTQGPDGKVITIQLPLSSGHPGIDEEVKDAITTAVNALPDPPPKRVAHGRPFSSTWRLRATWTMVPPTAFLTGAGFDITPKGFQMDVPFEITLKTVVSLLKTDAHTQTATSDAPEP